MLTSKAPSLLAVLLLLALASCREPTALSNEYSSLAGTWRAGSNCFALDRSGTTSYALEGDTSSQYLRGGQLYSIGDGYIEVGLPRAVWPDRVEVTTTPYLSSSGLAIRVAGVEAYRVTDSGPCGI
ncbi:MAG TPA: hypothetical protein VFG22_14580 [Polyangiales bacterium]|nr:hypothetical protein [Polyangiales bacterium]